MEQAQNLIVYYCSLTISWNKIHLERLSISEYMENPPII